MSERVRKKLYWMQRVKKKQARKYDSGEGPKFDRVYSDRLFDKKYVESERF